MRVGIFLCLLLLSAAAPAAAGEKADLLEALQADGRFRTLLAALEQADRIVLLQGEGPLTLFGPTDEAFAALPAATRSRLFAAGSQAELQRVLDHHVVLARVTSADLLKKTSVGTRGGSQLPVRLRVGEARVTQADIVCRNGILHVLDRVLLPPAKVRPGGGEASSAEAWKILRAAIDRGAPLFNEGDIAGCAKVYDEAAAKVLGTEGALPAWDRMRLAAVRAKPYDGVAAQAWALRGAFDRILERGLFKPRLEAALPAAYPGPSPLGRIVRKAYPASRVARTPGGTSFWALFNHIKKHGVRMTTPVVETLDSQGQIEGMAFLYEKPDQGTTGVHGDVTVADVAPVTVLSLAMRGERTEALRQAAQALMKARLTAEGLEAVGAWRVLRYHGPAVPAARRVWELQVALRP